MLGGVVRHGYGHGMVRAVGEHGRDGRAVRKQSACGDFVIVLERPVPIDGGIAVSAADAVAHDIPRVRAARARKLRAALPIGVIDDSDPAVEILPRTGRNLKLQFEGEVPVNRARVDGQQSAEVRRVGCVYGFYYQFAVRVYRNLRACCIALRIDAPIACGDCRKIRYLVIAGGGHLLRQRLRRRFGYRSRNRAALHVNRALADEQGKPARSVSADDCVLVRRYGGAD